MAREASLTMDLSLYSDSIAEILTAMHGIGWECTGEYLPLHDDDLFDWQDGLSAAELLALTAQKQAAGELCGAVLRHTESGRGVALLAENTADIMLNLTIHRKKLCGDFTDISWYMEQIAAKLEAAGCTVQSVRYTEQIG